MRRLIDLLALNAADWDVMMPNTLEMLKMLD